MSGVIQDITEHKQAEDALLRSEKLKTLGQITGGIAHDFNNLLTVIGLNIETALIDDALPEDLRSLLEPALRATERGSELTRQMLTYARRPSLRPVVVDLRKLLEALRPLLVRGVGDRLDLRLVLPDAAVPVRLDPGQFENALLNLAINARDAMPDGGTVTITVSAEMVQHALQRVPDLVPAGPQAVVRVTDTGHGISAEVLPRIVEPFFTTKALGKGSGLGLSMVYGFIHQSGGSFSMLSEPGVGTTMELYFPLSEAEGTVAVAASAGLGVRQRSGNALLVEDRADLRAAMHRVLEQIGFTACSVGSAAAALEIVQAPGALDLLICDVTLPGRMDGPMLAAAAQAMRPNLPILLISGATQIVEEDAPKWPFLPKPFRVSDIAAALDLLEQG
jgi:nitrogen-specific signal transduction histidine kinase/CheY-like chemotaxis protein